MCKEVKVSVIVPVYNVELYLKECLDTVVNQTLKEIEIIIVNDGSTDSSGKIIEEYANQYENIITVVQENHGLGHARNQGFRKASGEYIYFMDSDDKIDIDMLENLYNLAIHEKLDTILFDADVFCEEEELKDSTKNFNYVRKQQYTDVMDGITIMNKMIDNNDYKTSVCLRFISRTLLEELKINFLEGIIHEDEWFSFKTLLESKRVKHVPNQYFHRRVRSNSIMTARTRKRSFVGYYESFLLVFGEYEKYYTNNKGIVAKKYLSILFRCMYDNYVNMDKEDRYLYKKEWKISVKKIDSENLLKGWKVQFIAKYVEIYRLLRAIKHK